MSTTTTSATRSDAVRSLTALRALVRSKFSVLSAKERDTALSSCDKASFAIVSGDYQTAIDICEHRTLTL